MNISTMASIVKKWAKDKPQICKIHFFGSRVKGTNNQNSDLDIAVSISPSNEAVFVWFDKHAVWTEQLNKIIPYDVHLELDEGDNSPTIKDGLNDASYLVYEGKEI